MLLRPRLFHDERGYFYEAYNTRTFRELGIAAPFVQDNHSSSVKGVLRGLHYQRQQVQGKLVSAIVGKIFDVAVDLRQSSPYFGRWVGYELSEENHRHLWIPEGFAHGFLVLSDSAKIVYKVTDFYSAEHEVCIRWDDSDLAIAWPLQTQPVLSKKDSMGIPFKQASVFD